MWKLDLEDNFFKIYDSGKQIAGYFDPDYGNIGSPDEEMEQIRRMHENADPVARGFLTVPMVKFGVFDERASTIRELEDRVEQARLRISRWGEYIGGFPHTHTITVSHTDPDMLSITLEMRFEAPVPLDRKVLGERLGPTLDRLQGLGLL